MLLLTVARRFELSAVRARSVIRAAIFHGVLVAGITAVKIATNALYLARRDVRDLPYLYLATALSVAAVTVALARRLVSESAKPILRRSLGWVAGVLLGLSALAALDVRGALAGLYVVGEVYATALSVLFWSRLGEVFDVRAQKRVYGLISAFGMAGATVAGLAARGLSTIVPNLAWCVVAAASLLVIRPLLGRERAPASMRRERAGFAEGLRYATRRSFPRGVAGLVLLLSVQTAAVDFVFRSGTHRVAQGSEAEMTALFGSLNAIVGVLAIAFQTTVTARILGRLGVFTYLSLVPAVSVLIAVAAMFEPDAWVLLFGLKVVEMMASFSLNQPGLQLLYNPMPPAVRGPVRAFIDGAVKKLGGALGGVLLLLVGAALDDRQLLALVIAVATMILVSMRVLRPLYVQALEQKLGGREPARVLVLDASEKQTRSELIRALHDGDERRTMAALSVLEHEPRFDVAPHIGALFSHPSATVRAKVAELVERAPDPKLAPALEAVITRPGKHPKAPAARALMAIAPERARAVLEPVLVDDGIGEDRGLVAAALVALIDAPSSGDASGAYVPVGARRGGSFGAPPAGSSLGASPAGSSFGAPPAGRSAGASPASPAPGEGGRVGSALSIETAPSRVAAHARGVLERMIVRSREGRPSERKELAWVLGQLRDDALAPELLRLLQDPVRDVRLAALEAAERAPDESFFAALVACLQDRPSIPRARQALAALGDEAVPLLQAILDDRRLDVGLRVQVPRVLRLVGTTAAASAMLFSNRDDDHYLRSVIIEELHRMRRLSPGVVFHRAQTQGAALRRLREFRTYRPIAADLAAAPAGYALLHRATEDRVRQNLEGGLRLLGLVDDPQRMENVYRGLMSKDGGAKSDALEILDVALTGGDARGEALAIIEDGEPHGDGARAAARARELCGGPDLRLAVLAAATLRRLGETPPEVREPTSGEPLMAKSIVDRVFLLQNVQLFRGLAVDDLAAVAGLVVEGHAEPRETIYAQGALGDSLFVVISGDVHLLRNGQPLLDMHVGDSFGQTSILDGGVRPVTAQAGDEGCEYVRLDRAALMDLMSDRPELMKGMFVELAARIRELIMLTEGHEATSLAPPPLPGRAKRADSSRPSSVAQG